MTNMTPSPERDALIATLRSRQNEDFDGECTITNEEANKIIALLEATHLEGVVRLREALAFVRKHFAGVQMCSDPDCECDVFGTFDAALTLFEVRR